MFSYSDRSDYELEPRRSVALWLFHHSEPKLRADLDAPVLDKDEPICPACGDTGIRSYHDLPGSYGVEPCGNCWERMP